MSIYLYMLAYCRDYGQDWNDIHEQRVSSAQRVANLSIAPERCREEALLQLGALEQLDLLAQAVDACFATT